MSIDNKFHVASFFSGAGGLDIGFEEAGFKVVFASDIMKESAATYRRNFSEVRFAEKDINLISEGDLISLAQGKTIDIVIGGPPCQGFSNMGNKNSADPRNYLFQSYKNAIRQLKPQCFLFENVTGFKTMFEGRFFEKVINEFLDIGYNIHYSLLNANDYGVPQKRQRIFIFGTKSSSPFYFPPKNSNNYGRLKAFKSVGEAIVQDKLLEPLYESPEGSVTAFDILYGHKKTTVDGNIYMIHKGGFTYSLLNSAFYEAGFKARYGGRRLRAFDLFLVAFKQKIPEEEIQKIANPFFPT